MACCTFETSKFHDKIEFVCDECSSSFIRRKRDAVASRMRAGGSDLCRSCMATLKSKDKPQCSSSFWTDESRKKAHGDTMRSSDAYKESLITRSKKLRGPGNGMYGKKHTPETIAKMSAARTGKIGENATAWKGGNESLLKRVKRALQRRHRWFSRVFDRDHGKCRCGSKGSDAHHIKPMAVIVRDLLREREFENDDQRLDFLLTREEVIDTNLNNGVTLCRPCHREAHGMKWGSHNQ